MFGERSFPPENGQCQTGKLVRLLWYFTPGNYSDPVVSLFSRFMLQGLLICFPDLIPASGKTRKGGISLLNHEYYAWREFAQTKECRSDAGR